MGKIFADEEMESSKLPSLPDLIVLQKQEVQNYKAYQFHVDWIDGKPLFIDIVEEVRDLKNKKTDSKELALVESKSSTEVANGVSVFQNAVAGFSISKIVRSLSKEGADETKESLMRYDSYDASGKIRSSEWRNGKNGTQVEYLIFSDDGKPLTMTFYYKLKTNEKFKPLEDNNKFLVLSLDQVVSKFGTFDYSNANDVIDICIKLLNRAKELQGDNDD